MRISPVIGRAPSGPAGRTYAEFASHILTLANTDRGWGLEARSVGSFRTTAAADVGEMTGTSWGNTGFPNTSSFPTSVCRAIQHAMPSEAIYRAVQASSENRMLYTVVSTGTQTNPPGLNRNGYTSANYTGTVVCRGLSRLLYWYAGKAWEMNPTLSSGPVPYSW